MIKYWVVVLLAVLLVGRQAQAQETETLQLAVPVNGSLSAGGEQTWAFNARDGQMLSFVVTPTTDALDPVLTIRSSDGVTLISNDDYDYPTSRAALLEGISLPRTGTYTATVSAYGQTAGDYTLTMLPGYAQIAASENFNAASAWARGDSSPLEVLTVDGRLTLALAGIGVQGLALDAQQSSMQDYYAQVNVSEVSGDNGWQVGISVRQQNADEYYAAFVNSDGLWRFVTRAAQSEGVLRDWSSHPAIVAGETAFSLGVLANGASFEFYYNGQYIGQVTDARSSGAGRTGLLVGTAQLLDASVRAQFDNLLITVPYQGSAGGVFPQALTLGSPTASVQELQRRRLIPSLGEMALVVDESFGQSVRAGVSRFPLGRGLTFSNFAYGATVEIQTQAAGAAGCGLLLRAASDTEYIVAYVDQTGGYGLSPRVNDVFQPGLFGEGLAADGAVYELLVIANDDVLHYYINGQHVGRLNAAALEGGIGIAVVNFEPLDTTCQFRDMWLWQWG